MTVHDLIELLKREDPSLEARFEFPSHDYWRTNLVAEVKEVAPMIVHLDSYHDQYSVPRDELTEEDLRDPPPGHDRKKVVVLRGYRR